MILSQVLDRSAPVGWDSIAGLGGAKQALQEAVVLPTLRADLFQVSSRRQHINFFGEQTL